MSKSTKWMKKGFAWLLCLIMMTGMLSSAAVAADATAPKTIATPGEKDNHISFTYESQCFNTGAISWTDEGNKTSVKDLTFSFVAKVTKHSTNMGSKYTVEQYWYYKEPGANEYTHISIKNDKGEDVDHYTDQAYISYNGSINGSINASFKHPFKIEDAAEARKGGSYFCRVYFYETTNKNEVKQIGVADTKVITLSVTAKMTFKGAGKFGSDLVVMAQPGQLIPLDKRPIPTTIDNKDFVGWEDSETKEIFYTDSTKVKKGGYFTPVYKANKQAIGLNSTYELTYNGEVRSVDIVGADGKPVTIPSTAYTLVYNRVAPDENGNPVFEPKDIGWYIVTLSLTDEGREKYELIDGTVKSQLRIYQKPITVFWSNDSFDYDGDEHCPEATADGLCGNDTCELTVEGGGTNAGSDYVASVTEISNVNYCFAADYEGQTKTFSIAKREVKFEWDEKKTFVYDEQSHVPTIKEGSLEGFVEGDDVDYTITINKNESKEVGKYTATFSLTGTSAENYVLVSEATTEFSIVKKQPEITITNLPENNTVQYGDTFTINYSLTEKSDYQKVTVEGPVKRVNGREVNVISAVVNPDGTIQITALQPIDNAVITVKLGGETNHYYAASESFELKITKRKLSLEWDKDTFTYNGQTQHPKVKTIYGLVGKDTVYVSYTGGQKNAGEGYSVTASINSDYYVLDESTATQAFTIKKAASSISVTKSNITKTYGEEPFTVSADTITGGTNVTVDVQWNNGVAYLNRENKVVITGAGEAYIKLTNKGDKNHEESSVTIKLTVDKKKVPVVWDNPDDPEVFTWDGYSHCPNAHVDKSYLVGKDTCDVYVSGSTKNVGTFTAKVTGLSNKNYEVDKEYSKKFTIKDVVKSTKLTTNWQTKTVYYIPVDEEKIELNLTGISIVEKFESGARDRITQVTSDMIDTSFDSAKLGKQNVKVNYNNMEFTFEIQIIKMIQPVWGDTNLTYTGEVQAPEFSVKGLKDDDAFDKVIKVTADKNALDVNKNNTRYMAMAEIKGDFYDKYIFTDSHHHSYKYYTIAPKPVTLTWSFDGAAFKPSILSGYDCDFFADSKVLAPTGKIDVDADILALTISDADGNPIENATAVGVYTIEASLKNSNYVFKAETTTSVSFRIINKASGADISVFIPQCGQQSAYYGSEIRAGIEYVLNGMSRIPVADLDMVAMNQTAAAVATSDEKPVVEKALVLINWASLEQADANSKLGVRGILVPQVKGTFEDDESFFDAIGSLEDDVVSVKGETTYSVILILTADSMTGFDADAINLIVSDEKENQKALRYVVATEYGVVALVDIDAVHNYDEQNPTIVDPEEGVPGSRTVKCYLVQDNVNQYNHDFVTSIDALEVTKIEVVKGEGFTDNYFVGDAFDYSGLKIKVYLSNGEEAFDKSYERDVTEDMISGFDTTEAGKKTVNVEYKGQKATFEITVSKKQSSIDLKDIGEKVTVTYGDNPIDLVFDAFNGDVNISSSNENVAKVENGKLVIVGAGEAEITLEIKDTNAVKGFKKSFKFVVDQKVVGLEWSKDNTFTEDGAKHSLTAKATGLVGTDSCDVIVEGGSAEVGTHTVTATGLSNKNYKLPENASTTFVIKAKEEPKTEDPKKEEPKTEDSKTEEPKTEEPKTEEPKTEDPKQEEPKADDSKQDAPKKSNIEIKVSNQFKTTYIEGEEIDPTGLTIEFIDADGNKKVIQVTKDMITGFNSQKVGDSNVTITYEDVTKMIPVTIIEKGDYTFTITTEANGDMHFVVIRKPGNDIAFSLYLGTYVDGKLVPADAIKTWPGSVHGLLFADYLKTLPAGDHKIEVVFKDGKAVATLTIPATTPASDASPVTGDTSSLTMWIILLAAAAAVLVTIRVYAAKRSNAE